MTEFSKAVSEEIVETGKRFIGELPSPEGAREFLDFLSSFLFPREERGDRTASDVQRDGNDVIVRLRRNLTTVIEKDRIEGVIDRFVSVLPDIYRGLLSDAEAIYRGDPAAESVAEVVIAYPGFYAIFAYRIANFFYHERVPLFPRLLTEYAHGRTGVDIHPGATIGSSFCIDHATGIVIGETCRIGDNVKVYQGVTLGALSVDKGQAKLRRHPTIEDNVVIYANATILGGETTIGRDSVVGGNAWIIESVPSNSIVTHASDVRIKSGER